MKLHEETRNAEKTGETLCLLMADIDHFKSFNDSYGHCVGDEVLKIVARTLKEAVKGQDTASRYGGEDFALLLPRTGLDGAAALANQLRPRQAAAPSSPGGRAKATAPRPRRPPAALAVRRGGAPQ